MYFHDQFEKFEPVCGDVPKHPFAYLPEIAARARSVLVYGWTTDRMVAAAKKINDEIERYFSDLKHLAVEKLRTTLLQVDEDAFETYFEWDGIFPKNEHWVFRDEMIEVLEIPTAADCSEVDTLKTIIEDRDSCFFLPQGATEPQVDHWPEGKTHELFAVLSLWLLADAIESAQNGDKFAMAIAGEYAVKAMDAVCHAEHVREVERLEQFHKKSMLEISRTEDGRIQEMAESIRQVLAAEQTAHEQLKRSARSERLNAARHAKRNTAKAEACEKWAASPTKYVSFDKAGSDLADWVVDNQLLEKAEPRTVAGWLREYAKVIGFSYRLS